MKEKNKHINSKPRTQNPELRTRNPEPVTSRRGFLKKLWGVLGIAAGIEMTWITFSFLSPGKRKYNKASTTYLIVAGKVADFKLNSVFPFRNGKFFLIRRGDGGFLAVSLKCTHLGCSVLWNEEKQEFICPCHASSFDKNGVVMNPPAPRPLDIYPVIVEEGIVKVDTGNPQRRKSFDENQIVYV